MKASDLHSVRLFSSQEDGGGAGSSGQVLSQDSHESEAPLGLPDAVRGDVSGHQHLYILQRLLQQA